MKVERRTVTPQPPPTEYVITLSEEEANALCRLAGWPDTITECLARRKDSSYTKGISKVVLSLFRELTNAGAQS